MKSPFPTAAVGGRLRKKLLSQRAQEAGAAGAFRRPTVIGRAPHFPAMLRRRLLCMAPSVHLLRTEPLFTGTAVPLIHGPVPSTNGLCWT